jgi:hypothetical protein
MSLAVRKISFVDAADGFREREERDESLKPAFAMPRIAATSAI